MPTASDTRLQGSPRTRRRGTRARTIALLGVHTAAGAALTRRLDDDERVGRLVLLDRYAPAVPLRKAVFSAVDVTATLADGAIADTLARERVETVIHGAFHDAPVRNVESAHELEVIGTRALLRAVAHDARRSGTVENVVVLGTTMSYGAHSQNPQYLQEDAPLRGRHYAFVADKIAVEGEVASFRSRTGMPAAILRAAWTLGATQTLAARTFAPLMVPAVVGRDPLMQLLHLEDLVDAVRLAAHGKHDGAFNIAGDGVLPLSTIIKLAARLRVAAPEASVRAALDMLWTIGVGVLPGAHVRYLRDTCVGDTTRARAVLGFTPRYSTRDVIARHVGSRGRVIATAPTA